MNMKLSWKAITNRMAIRMAITNRKAIRKTIFVYVKIAAGIFLAAVAIDVFLIPFKIAPGGWSGLATVIHHVTGRRLPVGLIMLALNAPLFVFGIRYIGRALIYKTVFATLSLSLAIDLFEPIARFIVARLEYGGADGRLLGNLMLYSVIGGAILGSGLGIVFRYGGTTGGSDLAARIFSHFFPDLTIGRALFIIDSIVVVIASVVFQSFVLGLYALIAIFVQTKTVDAFVEGVNFARAVLIISQKPDEIARKIMAEIGRGVTGLKGTGMYTGSEKGVLLCVLQRVQVPLVKEAVRGIDEDAFVILVDIKEVLGEGFSRYNR